MCGMNSLAFHKRHQDIAALQLFCRNWSLWRVQRPPPTFPSVKYSLFKLLSWFYTVCQSRDGESWINWPLCLCICLSVCLCLHPQALLYSSLHVTRSVLSWLLDDHGQLIKELWQAVAWLSDAGHSCVSAELCRLLFPDGAFVCLIKQSVVSDVFNMSVLNAGFGIRDVLVTHFHYL